MTKKRMYIFFQSASSGLSSSCDGCDDVDREDEVVLDEYVSDDEQREHHTWR